MNKRIAKKVLTPAYQNRLYLRWLRGEGPQFEPWPIVKQAQAYLDRRQTPWRRTRRVLRAARAWKDLEPGQRPSAEEIERVLAVWDEQRPYIWRAVRGRDHEHGSVEAGYTAGMIEVAEKLTGDEPFARFVWWTLAYFSDRWTLHRLGRMDYMMGVLRTVLRTGALPSLAVYRKPPEPESRKVLVTGYDSNQRLAAMLGLQEVWNLSLQDVIELFGQIDAGVEVSRECSDPYTATQQVQALSTAGLTARVVVTPTPEVS